MHKTKQLLLNRIMAVLLVIFMLLPSIPVFAVSGSSVSVGTASGQPGDQVSVTVSVSGNPGIAYLKLRIGYDASQLTLTGVTNSGLLSGTFTTSKTTDINPYVLQWMGAENATGNGVAATLTFQIASNASAGDKAISVTVDECYNESFDDVTLSPSDGKVTISEEISTGDINSFSATFKVMCESKSVRLASFESSSITRTVYRDDQVKVVGYVYNSYGNLWYKTDKGDYIHPTYLYAIDYNELPPSNYCNAQFEVKCTSKALKGNPKSSSDTLKTYVQGNIVNVTGYVYNEYGNLWYETSNGGYIYCDYLSLISSDERTPSNYLDTQMKVVASSKALRGAPYSSSESKGSVYQNNNVSIKGYLYNQYGNLWYITDDDCYIYSNYLQQISNSSLIPSNYIYANSAVTAEKDCKSEPYVVSDLLDTWASGKLINTIGYVINLFGDKWFECEDGGFIYDSNLVPAYYTVSYNSNGGTGAPMSQTKTYGQTLTLSSTKPIKSGYSFVGWATSDIATVAVYEPEAEFSIDENITLYAVWEKNVVLSSISIYCKPSKITYYIGDSLNTSGLQLKLTYSDGSTKTVSSGFTTSGFSSTTAGTRTVTVSYGGKTTTFNVTVNTPSVSLSSTSKSMRVGDTVTLTATTTPSGQTVTWTSSNTSVATVSGGTITAKASGSATITAKFTYNGNTYSKTCSVTVTSAPNPEPTLSAISIATKPTKTSYEIGESLNTSGLTLKLTYSDGSTETVSSGFTTSGFSSANAGTKTVTVSYGGKTTSFTVTVKAVAVDGTHVVIESKKVLAGKEFTVSVNIKNNPGFTYLEVTPTYSSELSLVSVENGELISDLTQGKQYIWVADNDVYDDGILMTFTFTTAENVESGNYEVGFIVRGCVNYDEQNVDISVVNGVIEIIDFTYGDANGDGVINGQDIVRIKKYLANFDYDTETSTVEINAGADANGDGVISGQDVVRLKKYLANYDYETDTSTIVLGPQN